MQLILSGVGRNLGGMDERLESSEGGLPENERFANFRLRTSAAVHAISQGLRGALEELTLYKRYLECTCDEIDEMERAVACRVIHVRIYLMELETLLPTQQDWDMASSVWGFLFAADHEYELKAARDSLRSGGTDCLLGFEHELGLKTRIRPLTEDLYLLAKERRLETVRRNVRSASLYACGLQSRMC